MTKDSNSKSKMLGRLIFGDKRKQRTTTTRHRSNTRNTGKGTEAKSSNVTANNNNATNKESINIHDWAVWRMHLNEQMGNGMVDQVDMQQIRQFLQSNSFYQQHSRDPSNGRYNGLRLLFSIPHAKLQPELNDGSRNGSNKITHLDIIEPIALDQLNSHHHIDERLTAGINSMPTNVSVPIDKKITQILPKGLINNTDGFLHVNEQMIPADVTRTRCSMRAPYTGSDRIHATLQKAVKDGNVLEKIKAFEMQAAAVQAELTPRLNRNGYRNIINNRMQTGVPPMQSRLQQAFSPVLPRPIQQPISPQPIQYESSQQQHVRSHQSRSVHPVERRRDDRADNITGHVSRKGAHVLEPAHGDVILKRRTPSQKTVNDDDYSMTMMSSMALTTSQGHRQHHHHHHSRASASRSRHRPDQHHEKRSASHHDQMHKKQTHKQKETTPSSSSNKTNTRCRWLIGRKENTTDNVKQDSSKSKSNKIDQNKKKTNEKEKRESSKRVSSSDSKGKRTSTPDQNRVYDVPKPIINEQIKSEPISPQPPSRIDEENESDREEKLIENQTNDASIEENKQKNNSNQEYETKNIVERRINKTKAHQTLPSIDGEIQSKVEDETRFSRPTDDHAHRSELIDEDDECKSEGDILIEESSATNAIQSHVNPSNDEGIIFDRRWQWSKESGGLIERSVSKKKSLNIPSVLPEQNIHEGNIEPISTSITSEKKQINSAEQKIESNSSKQMLHTLIHSKIINQEQITNDEFFENGPHTNPEESFTTSA